MHWHVHRDPWNDEEEMRRTLVLSGVVVCLGVGPRHIQTLSSRPTFLLRSLQWPFSVPGAKFRFLPWPVVSLSQPSHTGFQALLRLAKFLLSSGT